MPNKLQYENSPYLKQHANNPVDWLPWGEEALQKAKNENKLLLVSIGYSACHWCHVMERESFENEAIAQTMNRFFVPVKIDREERPDIDQIYMLAVQLMTNAGGWPLNCICLPDGRPIYGGTYFKPHDWQQVLLQLAQMWEDSPKVAIDYAERLTKGIEQAENLPILPIPETYTQQDLHDIVEPWIRQFDTVHGGYNRAPKFPLPNNWLFLLRYAVLAENQALLTHVHFTLQKMACGGIYDHIGGGFARYSVDERWHIPHFEKMLYDNAQLISLYSEAYQQAKNPLYKRLVNETIGWVKREMRAENGGFYAALDADSEGVEGKFYTFYQEEFEKLLGQDASLLSSYFNLSQSGNWEEEETNVLYCSIDADQLALTSGFSESEWEIYLQEAKAKLLAYREQRIRPGLDHKQLTSWNALLVKGLVDAYRTFDEATYVELALQTAAFIWKDCRSKNKELLHLPADDNREILAFLDDYAFSIESFIALYEATFDESWLEKAHELMDTAIHNFYDEQAKTFYYTATHAEKLISRKTEVMDNVIPSSSSSIVRALYRLGELEDNAYYLSLAEQVFANVFPQIKKYGSAYSNWAIQLLELVYGNNEIALVGEEAAAWRKAIDQHYIPNKVTLGGIKSELPLLKDKVGLESKSYLCKHKTCSLPQNSVEELLALINK